MARITVNGVHGSLAGVDRLQAAERVVDALEEFSPALEELGTYSDRDYCRFPLDYRQQFWVRNESLSVLHGFIHILRVRASARLALGQTSEAFHDVQLALCLLDYSRQQPWVMTTERRYSVGFNGTDDGGRPNPRGTDWQGQATPMPDPRKLDWVWTHPAERAHR